MHERIRDKFLGVWGHTVASRPLLTLTICMSITLLSVYLTITHLEFHAERSELIDPNLSWNKQYAQYKVNFPRWSDVVVVIDGEPGDQDLNRLVAEIAIQIQADEKVISADAGFDAAEAGPKLFAVAPRDQFDKALSDLGEARKIAACENANAALGFLLSSLATDRDDPGAVDRLDDYLKPFLAAASGKQASFDFLLPNQSRWEPFASESGEGRLRFILVQFQSGNAGIDQLAGSLKWLRSTVSNLIANSANPKIDWGVTGLPVIESDETSQSIADSTVASIIAIILITALMVAAFRGGIVPFLAAASLLVGISWSFGWLVIAVGHLQILSVVFSVILLGLGIDFALLFVSRLELVQDEHKDLPSATARVFRGIGPGMVTGAVTTAAAFASTALTQFKGMAEMGIIAGGGIILCLFAVLSMFPACLALTGRWKKIIRHRPGGETAHFAHGRLDRFDGNPKTTLAVAAFIVIIMAIAARSVGYDSNVINLQPPNLESVVWNKRVVEEDEQSVWSGVVLAKPDQAAELCMRLHQAPKISGVGAMGMLYPSDWPERDSLIRKLREETISPAASQPGMGNLLGKLELLSAGIALQMRTINDEAIGLKLSETTGKIARSVNTGLAMDADAQSLSWNNLNDAFNIAKFKLSTWVDQALDERLPGIEDLPPILRELWVGIDGSWLLLVYPEADAQQRSILDPQRLVAFVHSMQMSLWGTGVTPIGPPIQIYESGELIKRAYRLAALYAITAILVLLFLDFRSLADALCAMTPVTIGFIGAFGIMGLTGMPLNFANMIILPVIFGVGVTAGVHTVHRWRAEPDGRPAGLSGATGRGITLTMLTTMIGFGCLLISEHRGIKSLAIVMLMGLSITLLACYTVLPAILRLRTVRGKPSTP